MEIKVSLFKNIYNTKDGKDTALDEILDKIKSGAWEAEAYRIRALADKSARDEEKKKLPYFTPAGTFSQRNNQGLKLSSGLIGIDIDNIPADQIQDLKQAICEDGYTFACWITVSGKGLFVLVKIDSTKHLDAFLGLQTYYWRKFETVVDPACKDLSRSRTVSFDPDLYHNPNSIKFKEYVQKPKKEERVHGYLHVHDHFEKVIYGISSDICNSYLDWFRCGMAIANTYGDAGFKYFEHISQFRESSKKDFEALVEKQYKYCLSSRDKSIDIGTLYFFIKQAGYEIRDQHTELIAKTAFFAKSNGMSQERTVEHLQKYTDQGVKKEQIENIVESVWLDKKYNPAAVKDESGQDSMFDDIIIWLNTNYSLKKNEITKAIENEGNELEQEDLNSIYIKCKKLFPKIRYEDLFRIINSANTPKYNPIKEYLESLEYNSEANIKKLVQSINTDTGTLDWRVRMVERWFVGIIESVYGKKSLLMWVLTGIQDSGKTEFFLQMMPTKLRRYFAASQLDAGKDDKLLMTQKLLIFDDEMAGKSKADAKNMKLMLSADSFTLRAPYERKNCEYKRLAVLCGTSNEDEVLNDPTGNRRYIIFNVIGKNDFELYNSIDKDQLFAEAYHNWKVEKMASTISLEDKKLMYQYTFEQHYEATIDAETIQKFFIPAERKMGFFKTTSDIKDHIEGKTNHKIFGLKRLGSELKRLGYKRYQDGPNRSWGYWVKLMSEFTAGGETSGSQEGQPGFSEGFPDSWK